jgi:predicted RNA binding protein YcfA (HicA-like mRNA interferase family)
MSRRPRVTAPALIAALSNAGFTVLRIKGSHHFLGHENYVARRVVEAAGRLRALAPVEGGG